MKPIRPIIIFASLYLLFYTISPYIGVPDDAIILMFTLSPLLVIWMVIGVLKYGEPSTKTWEEGHWYEDKDVNNVETDVYTVSTTSSDDLEDGLQKEKVRVD